MGRGITELEDPGPIHGCEGRIEERSMWMTLGTGEGQGSNVGSEQDLQD